MSLANYGEDLLANWLFTAGAATRPTSWFLALHSADPTETGAVAELSGNGYARTAVSFGAASNGKCLNSNLVTFPEATGNWATVTHASIWTAASGGSCLISGALQASQTVLSGQVLEFKVGTLDVGLE
jgi:hypothetical protein